MSHKRNVKFKITVSIRIEYVAKKTALVQLRRLVSQHVFSSYETDYWLTCYKETVEKLNAMTSEPVNLFVHREGYIAGYYANENITVHDMRGALSQIQSGDYLLVNSRTNEDKRVMKDVPPLIQVGREGALFCTIGRVP